MRALVSMLFLEIQNTKSVRTYVLILLSFHATNVILKWCESACSLITDLFNNVIIDNRVYIENAQ